MYQNTKKLDYLSPGVSELAAHRGGLSNDPSNAPKVVTDHRMARVIARQLLPACLIVPTVLWWGLTFGVHRGWYHLDTCLVLFACSVSVVFGITVCFNLKKLSQMDAHRARAEEQFALVKDALEATNRSKSLFFANLSHEIRTPLTAINGFAEMMLNPDRTQDQRLADARVIRRNGEHLLTLINDILDLSKIEAGKMSVETIPCCPAEVVGEVASMLRHRATDKGLSLDVSFEGQIPKMIRTDPTRLRQILINLTANAVKFTETGSVRLIVSVKPAVGSGNSMLEIRITDTGIGITPEQQAQLFQPFVQGESSITRQYGGTGLGLAISRHFAQALGGDIAVSSEPGRGSTFTVRVATGSLIDAEVHESPEKSMDHLPDKFAAPKVRISGSVLVAEDGIDNQALIATRLRETGLKIEIAPNGQIACDKAMAAIKQGTPYDLILMDVQMPLKDGFTATMELRSNGYRGPIIALTANAMERDRSKCLNAGCNDFVTKPIQMEKLFKAIGRFLKVVPVTAPPTILKVQSPVAATAQAA